MPFSMSQTNGEKLPDKVDGQTAWRWRRTKSGDERG